MCSFNRNRLGSVETTAEPFFNSLFLPLKNRLYISFQSDSNQSLSPKKSVLSYMGNIVSPESKDKFL